MVADHEGPVAMDKGEQRKDDSTRRLTLAPEIMAVDVGDKAVNVEARATLCDDEEPVCERNAR